MGGPLGSRGSGAPTTLARPQSRTYTSPKSPSMTLPGLRSRWTTPRDVGEVDRVADAREGAEELAACELADGFLLAHAQRVDDSLESHPADALHREVERSVGVAPEVVHRDDRRVLELPLDARLAKEADGGGPRATPSRA